MKVYDLSIQNDRRLNLIRLLQEAGFTVQSPWPFDQTQLGYYPPVIISKDTVVITSREVEADCKNSHLHFSNCRARIKRTLSNTQIVNTLVWSVNALKNLPVLFDQFVSEFAHEFLDNGVNVTVETAASDTPTATFYLNKHLLCYVRADEPDEPDDPATTFEVEFPHIEYINQEACQDWNDFEYNEKKVAAEGRKRQLFKEDVHDECTDESLVIYTNSVRDLLSQLEQNEPWFVRRKVVLENTAICTLVEPGAFVPEMLRHGVKGIAEKEVKTYRTSPCPFTDQLIQPDKRKLKLYAIEFHSKPEGL